MRKIFGFVLCCVIPSKNLRQVIREKFYVTPGKTYNRGKNNRIILIKPDGTWRCVKTVPGCRVWFRGDNNTIRIHQPLKRLHLVVKMYGDSNITIMSSIFLDRSFKIHGMRNCNLFVDSDLFTNSEVLLEFSQGTDIHIGKNCIISDYVEIRTGDGHPIIDASGARINQNKSVFIGNHIWVGKYVMILKGSKILDNSVIGARSMVTKSFDSPGVVVAGSPARVIKTGIDWEFK